MRGPSVTLGRCCGTRAGCMAVGLLDKLQTDVTKRRDLRKAVWDVGVTGTHPANPTHSTTRGRRQDCDQDAPSQRQLGRTLDTS